jgi:hypothetical protein
MIYTPRKTGSGIEKLRGGRGDIQTHRQQVYLINLLLFIRNKEIRLIKIMSIMSKINSVS